MRQLFIAAVLAAVAGALASCDPRPLKVMDNSALKSITLQVNNDSPKWEFGEERIFTVVVNPATAICERFELKAYPLPVPFCCPCRYSPPFAASLSVVAALPANQPV